MSPSRNHRIIARQVPGEEIIDRRTATLSVRPLRFAFLIKSDATFRNLLDVIEYNSLIWGGRTNCIIPFSDEGLDSYWWNILERSDPDHIITYSNCDDSLLQELKRRIQPYSIRSWRPDANELLLTHRSDFIANTVPIWDVLQDVWENKEPIDNSLLRIPRVDQDSLLGKSTIVHFGYPYHADNSLVNTYFTFFGSESIDLDNIDLKNYLRVIGDLLQGEIVSPVDMTSLGLNSHQDGIGIGDVGYNLVLFTTNTS